MKVPRGIHHGNGGPSNNNHQFSGSAISKKSGRRRVSSSIMMDGSVKNYEMIDDIVPLHDDLSKPLRSSYAKSSSRMKEDISNSSTPTPTTTMNNRERESSHYKDYQHPRQIRKSRNGGGSSGVRASFVAMDGHIRNFDSGSRSTQPSTLVVRSVRSSASSASGSDGRTTSCSDDSENQTSFVAADTGDVLVVVNNNNNGDDVSFTSSKENGSTTTRTTTSSEKEKENRQRNWTWCILATVMIVLLAVGIALVVAYTVGNRSNNNSSKNVETTSTNANTFGSGSSCSPGGIKDTMEPQLELYMTGPTRLMNDTEIEEVQRLILVEYNRLSGGCDDEFQRWMYSVRIVNQTLTREVKLESEDSNSSKEEVSTGSNNNTGLENDLEDRFTLVALFGTMVSCNGCTQDSAFATEFPTSFGNATLITDSTDDRRLRSPVLDINSINRDSRISSSSAATGSVLESRITGVRGSKSVPSTSTVAEVHRRDSRKVKESPTGTMMTIDAGQILKAIEIAVVTRISDIEAIVEVKVFSVSHGEIINTRKVGRSD
jgi:hypothetical protein